MSTYKTSDDFYKEGLLFRCACGGSEFFEVLDMGEEWNNLFEVSFTQPTRNVWQKIKILFTKDEYWTKSVLLDKNDIKELKKYLEKR